MRTLAELELDLCDRLTNSAGDATNAAYTMTRVKQATRRAWRIRNPSVLAVCHTLDTWQVIESLEVAITSGADGMFLIEHGSVNPVNYEELLMACQLKIRKLNAGRDFRLGVNHLGIPAVESVKRYGQYGMVWSDTVDVLVSDQYANNFHRTLLKLSGDLGGSRGTYFGGIAFKYQPEVDDSKLAALAKKLLPYVDVLTTSGEVTGSPPSVQKMEILREAVGPDSLLAIASGITVENVEQFLPTTDIFLVATGVSETFNRFDPVKLKALCDKVHAYKKES